MPSVRYVTEADWDAVNGVSLRESLFADPSGSYDANEFNRAAEFASKHAQSVAKKAGYSIPLDTDGTVVDDFARFVALAMLTRLGYTRKQQEIPADLKELLEELVEGARTGNLPDPDLTSNTTSGPGGHQFKSPSTTRPDSTSSVFGTLKTVY
jgi:hypothetical protein